MSTPNSIAWGIIGAGKIAEKFATDLKTIPNANLQAIASRSLYKAKQFAQKHNAIKAYADYNALVEDPSIDAIYIATPHSFHKAHALLAMEHGKAVLCEKPFAMNLDEVEQMISMAETKNVLLMEAMWTIFLPHFQYTLQLLKAKHFGDVKKIEADFGFKSEYDENSRVTNKSLGGGSLLDIGIYPIFATLCALGTPKTIAANAEFFPNGADSETTIQFKYDNAEALLKSTLVEETKTEAVFYCEKGHIRILSRFHEPSSVRLTDENGKTELKVFECNTFGYNFEIEHFNQLIKTNKKESPLMTFNMSRQLMRTLDEIRQLIGLDYA